MSFGISLKARPIRSNTGIIKHLQIKQATPKMTKQLEEWQGRQGWQGRKKIPRVCLACWITERKRKNAGRIYEHMKVPVVYRLHPQRLHKKAKKEATDPSRIKEKKYPWTSNCNALQWGTLEFNCPAAYFYHLDIDSPGTKWRMKGSLEAKREGEKIDAIETEYEFDGERT